MSTPSETVKQETSSGKGRGPSYPILSLRTAIDRVSKLFKEEGKALVYSSVVVAHWGYSEKSSGGRQLISTLLQYGLLRDEGSGDQRKLAVSPLALDILLHDEGSAERAKAVKTAARSPKLFADILSHYAADGALPSDTNLKRFLIMERNISQDATDAVIKNFRDTVSYAKLLESSDSKADDRPVAEAKPKPDGLRPEVGDLIQWESGGVLQFDPPRKVRALTEADGVTWVFVEGSMSGIQMSETTVVDRPIKAAIVPPVLPEAGAVVASAVAVASGERECLRGPLSKEVSYRLFITGDLKSRELGKLIKLLQAQKAVLEDDDEEEA